MVQNWIFGTKPEPHEGGPFTTVRTRGYEFALAVPGSSIQQRLHVIYRRKYRCNAQALQNPSADQGLPLLVLSDSNVCAHDVLKKKTASAVRVPSSADSRGVESKRGRCAMMEVERAHTAKRQVRASVRVYGSVSVLEAA